MQCADIIRRLAAEHTANREELVYLLKNITPEEQSLLREKACEQAKQVFGNKIYIRGLIEISSYCKNNCYYCGIRRSNHNAVRYRLTKEDILDCCQKGRALGFRTFVLQGGEDGYFTDEVVCGIVREIKRRYPDCAVTLSLGERGYESFKRLREAGADRYLLRHETANAAHYQRLHPPELSWENRRQSLFWLKELGFQTGAGFMVGSPYQTAENLADDLLFIQELQPQMCGIGTSLPEPWSRRSPCWRSSGSCSRISSCRPPQRSARSTQKEGSSAFSAAPTSSCRISRPASTARTTRSMTTKSAPATKPRNVSAVCRCVCSLSATKSSPTEAISLPDKSSMKMV